MTQIFCADMARQVLQSANEVGLLIDRPFLKSSMPHMVAAAVDRAHTEQRLTSAWKHLMVSADDLPGVLKEAQLEKDAGVLFQEKAEEEGDEEVFVGGDEPAEEEGAEEEDPYDVFPVEADVEVDEPSVVEPLASPAEPQPSLPAGGPALMCRFLALRLAYGTASAKDLTKTVAEVPSVAGGMASQCRHVGCSNELHGCCFVCLNELCIVHLFGDSACCQHGSVAMCKCVLHRS